MAAVLAVADGITAVRVLPTILLILALKKVVVAQTTERAIRTVTLFAALQQPQPQPPPPPAPVNQMMSAVRVPVVHAEEPAHNNVAVTTLTPVGIANG